MCVHRDNYAASQVCPHVGGQEVWVIADKERDAFAESQAPIFDGGSERFCPLAQSAVGDLHSLEAQAQLLW
jgi:hypothetical protein